MEPQLCHPGSKGLEMGGNSPRTPSQPHQHGKLGCWDSHPNP